MRNFIFLSLCFISFCAWGETTVYFTPSNACEKTIIKQMYNAKKSIDIVVYSINNWNIVEALKEVKDLGVPIRILTDRQQAGGRGSKVPELHTEGFNIRVNSRHKIEHNKYVVIDGDTVITGSYNWTNPASQKNSENCLMIWNDSKTTKAYQQRFNYLWDINTAEKSEEWFKRQTLKKPQKNLPFDKSSVITDVQGEQND